jgi:hypothetical protein
LITWLWWTAEKPSEDFAPDSWLLWLLSVPLAIAGVLALRRLLGPRPQTP